MLVGGGFEGERGGDGGREEDIRAFCVWCGVGVKSLRVWG